jgi:hypothetical protein
MNRITRMLTITGLGLLAGVTIGAGPAMAATNTGQGTTQSAASDTKAAPGDRARVIRYFDDRRSCEFAGRIGERFGRWDDYDCYRVRWGWHRGHWALEAQWDGWHHGGGNGPWDHNNDGPWHHNGGGDGSWHHDGPQR